MHEIVPRSPGRFQVFIPIGWVWPNISFSTKCNNCPNWFPVLTHTIFFLDVGDFRHYQCAFRLKPEGSYEVTKMLRYTVLYPSRMTKIIIINIVKISSFSTTTYWENTFPSGIKYSTMVHSLRYGIVASGVGHGFKTGKCHPVLASPTDLTILSRRTILFSIVEYLQLWHQRRIYRQSDAAQTIGRAHPNETCPVKKVCMDAKIPKSRIRPCISES